MSEKAGLVWSAQALLVTEALVFGLGRDPHDEQRTSKTGVRQFVCEGA